MSDGELKAGEYQDFGGDQQKAYDDGYEAGLKFGRAESFGDWKLLHEEAMNQWAIANGYTRAEPSLRALNEQEVEQILLKECEYVMDGKAYLSFHSQKAAKAICAMFGAPQEPSLRRLDVKEIERTIKSLKFDSSFKFLVSDEAVIKISERIYQEFGAPQGEVRTSMANKIDLISKEFAKRRKVK